MDNSSNNYFMEVIELLYSQNKEATEKLEKMVEKQREVCKSEKSK